MHFLKEFFATPYVMILEYILQIQLRENVFSVVLNGALHLALHKTLFKQMSPTFVESPPIRHYNQYYKFECNFPSFNLNIKQSTFTNLCSETSSDMHPIFFLHSLSCFLTGGNSGQLRALRLKSIRCNCVISCCSLQVCKFSSQNTQFQLQF